MRAIALTNPEQFLRSARLAHAEGESRNAALATSCASSAT